ncbi:DNA helicase UvrD [Caulobacter radicis]|uniref:UvrD-helicase domain-containing protein n=1 Tax=Caulobacter radicis TaxID=2172650 RepID=UPI000D572A46|nr:UvrD-helicase domain-containing protein [Caulobacter radicis]PVM91763.1 DNA helicase UvrD [Caulobacter radicis]
MTKADEEIAECLKARISFLLDAGAGAGKTYSLVQALRAVLKEHRRQLAANGQTIACITFTNVAKDQILERIGHDAVVRVSTIHDFLWEVIAPHQKALKAALLKFNAALGDRSSRKKDPGELVAALPDLAVTYSDTGSNFLKGRLFHDDLLGVARIMFADNPLLCRLTTARHPFLFVDEYQDTSPAVIDIVLGNLLPGATEGFVVGLFGDKLQNIYHGGEHPGVGEIPAALAAQLRPIVKAENRRCSEAVIRVLNRIRTDIEQFPAADNAPGAAVYVHPGHDGDAGLAAAHTFVDEKLGWSRKAPACRELFLTHRLIAGKAGYGDLLALYAERGSFARDRLMDGEDPSIAYFLKRVEPLAAAWTEGDQGRTLSLLRANGHKLSSNADKRTARQALDELVRLRDEGTIGGLTGHIGASGLFPLLDDLAFRLGGGKREVASEDAPAAEREAREQTFYAGLFALPYREVRAFADFFAAHTPFATKHGVKGDEFDTVLVVLDDGGASWNLYSFSKYLSGEDTVANEKRWNRSRNVFYVCCSRAKTNLAVIDLTARSGTKDQRVRELFGADNAHFLG